MLQIRKSSDRGHANHGWLDSYHSFSFASYYDPRFMGWGNLRVINEDRVAPGMGFGTHGHRDMEIVSYVLSGELAHQDSMGNVKTIPAGDVQRMSAGSGVTHSEFNHSKTEQTHFLQIWIEPHTQGLTPSYDQRSFRSSEKEGQLQVIVSPDGAEDSLSMNANAWIYAGKFNKGQSFTLSLAATPKAYVHLVQGTLTVNGIALNPGDAVFMTDERAVELSDGDAAEVLVFKLSTP